MYNNFIACEIQHNDRASFLVHQTAFKLLVNFLLNILSQIHCSNGGIIVHCSLQDSASAVQYVKTYLTGMCHCFDIMRQLLFLQNTRTGAGNTYKDTGRL